MTSHSVGRDVVFGSESLPVNGRAVGLDIGALEQSALEHLRATGRCDVLEVVLDGLGLSLEVLDLSEQHAELVNLGKGAVHLSLLSMSGSFAVM